MEIVKTGHDGVMKIVVQVSDVVGRVMRFEEAPGFAMLEVAFHMRRAVAQTLKQVMKAEMEIFLGND